MGYSHCGPVNIFTAAGAGRIKNKVKELRKARGLRQEDVAALLGVSRQTVNAVESDKYGLGYEAGPPAGDSGGRAVYPRGLRTPPEPIRFGGRSRAVTI